ncbi:kinase-like domain-containing protein [Jimgerdemannia flammicorona]|uniref:Kinase-like domain-containing protein n=1 Tax=Jimgerdemannia flammicorona TaxID=994334 RepID=A0A433DGK9_9FUNG|nr:kinase-like domain-containing protein [Jimgerdemannia flammicorona]
MEQNSQIVETQLTQLIEAQPTQLLETQPTQLVETQPTQLVPDDDDNGSEVVYATLVPLNRWDLGQISLTPEKDTVLVGKDPNCNVVLPDVLGVSRKHFLYKTTSARLQSLVATVTLYFLPSRILRSYTTHPSSNSHSILKWGSVVGEPGNYSMVRQAFNRCTGCQYACKIINARKFADQPIVLRAFEHVCGERSSEGTVGSARSGISMLGRSLNVAICAPFLHYRSTVNFRLRSLRAWITSPNIVSFIDFYSNDETYWIIMEYVSGGDLNKYFDMKPVPEESEVKHLTRQICEAVQYMHERGFVHRDIKPDNILLASRDRGLVKLSDLGLAKFIGTDGTLLKTKCGTPAYLAPEIQNHTEEKPYSKAVDLWSLGVVVYQMIARKMPYECSTQYALIDAIIQGDLDLTPFTKGGYTVDFVTRLLEVDPKQRMTANEALKHPWLMDVTAAAATVTAQVEIKTEVIQGVSSELPTSLKTEMGLDTAQVEVKAEVVQEVSAELPTSLKTEMNMDTAQVEIKTEVVQEVSSELPTSLKTTEMSLDMNSGDGSRPSGSTGLTYIFEDNELLSAPTELAMETGSSSTDRPQVQPKTHVQKRSSPSAPRRVTRSQSKLEVAESAPITSVTGKKRPASSTDLENPPKRSSRS